MALREGRGGRCLPRGRAAGAARRSVAGPMGQELQGASSAPYVTDNVVGAFDFDSNKSPCNEENEIYWRTDPSKSVPFQDPAWEAGAPLRQAFNAELRGERMLAVYNEAARESVCWGSAVRLPALATALDERWCPEINAQLLNPAGYSCSAFLWRRGNDPNLEVVLIVIEKSSGPAAISAPTPSAPMVDYPLQ